MIDPVGIDVVGEVVEEPTGVHAEGFGDDLWVETDHEIDKPSGAQRLDGHCGRIEDVGQVRARCWCHPGLGDFGDHDVWVAGPELFSMGEAAFDSGEAGRVQGHWMGAAIDTDSAGVSVDVGGFQASNLDVVEGVEQRQQPDGGFVGMHIVAGGPAAIETALLSDGERRAGETSMRCHGDGAGGIDEHDLVAACPSEEVAQRGEPPATERRPGVEKRFDVCGLHDRPISLGSRVDEEQCEVPDDGDGPFDGGVRSRVGSGVAGPFLGTHEMVAEPFDRCPQRVRGAIDASTASAGSETGGLIETERELTLDEEVFEGASQRSC